MIKWIKLNWNITLYSDFPKYLLKPFVAKCFEVSPQGSVGLFERVDNWKLTVDS